MIRAILTAFLITATGIGCGGTTPGLRTGPSATKYTGWWEVGLPNMESGLSSWDFYFDSRGELAIMALRTVDPNSGEWATMEWDYRARTLALSGSMVEGHTTDPIVIQQGVYTVKEASGNQIIIQLWIDVPPYLQAELGFDRWDNGRFEFTLSDDAQTMRGRPYFSNQIYSSLDGWLDQTYTDDFLYLQRKD